MAIIIYEEVLGRSYLYPSVQKSRTLCPSIFSEHMDKDKLISKMLSTHPLHMLRLIQMGNCLLKCSCFIQKQKPPK